MTPLGRSGLIKRLTGVNLEATRQFLLQDCFVPGKGFSSQYAGQETVSCATSAICTYALSETGKLSRRQKREFQRVLLGFRVTDGTGRSLSEDDGRRAQHLDDRPSCPGAVESPRIVEPNRAVSQMASCKTGH